MERARGILQSNPKHIIIKTIQSGICFSINMSNHNICVALKQGSNITDKRLKRRRPESLLDYNRDKIIFYN